MSNCVKCGKELESETNQVCDSCKSEEQIASTAEVSSKFELNALLALFKKLITNPEEEIKNTLTYSNVLISSIIVILTALSISLTVLIFFDDLLGFYFYFFSTSSLKLFANTFFAVLLQWVILSFILFGLAKLAKYPIKIVQSFNIVGISQFYVLVMSLLMLIFSFINVYLAIISLFMGLLMSYLGINSGFRHLLKENSLNIYILPGSLIGLIIINRLLLSFFF